MRMRDYLIIVLLMLTTHTTAQDITNKLGGDTGEETYTIINLNDSLLFKVQADGGTLFTGPDYGTIPIEGGGRRMMWYPKRRAFRVGEVSGTQWNEDLIGFYSTATGYDTQASGLHSVAMGYGNNANHTSSIALGHQSTASAMFSIAMGYLSVASGGSSIALGAGNTASGEYAFSAGYANTASGEGSLALGYQSNSRASRSIAIGYSCGVDGNFSTAIGSNSGSWGNNAMALGNLVRADSDYSTALGNNVTILTHQGCFVIGDNSREVTNPLTASAANEMTMAFAGGYRLFSNSALTTGVTLPSGASSWTTISDSTKKENFQLADGENCLNSIKELKLGSWNYKAQDPSVRHYGPMAQEIYLYFGTDDFGTIGNDTTLATADMDGIIMIAIQALEKRTKKLQLEKDQEIASLKSEIEELKQLIGRK